MSTKRPTPNTTTVRIQVRPRRGAAATPLRALVRAWLRGELARRLGRLAKLLAAFTALVLVLYAKGETPAALAGSAVPVTGRAASAARQVALAAAAPHGTSHAGRGDGPGLPAAAPPVAKAPAAAGGAPAPAQGTAPPGAPTPAVTPGSPAAVAIAWYAAQEHLPPGKVRALQQDRRSDQEVRVLVLGDAGDAKLTTALVTVHRDGKGRWAP